MADAPKIMQDEFSIARGGSALFRLIWTDPLTADDKADLLDWLKLVERRIQRKPEGTPAENTPAGVPACGGGLTVCNKPDCGMRIVGVPGTPVGELQLDQMRRCCDGEVRLGAKCGRCGMIATVEHNLPATAGVPVSPASSVTDEQLHHIWTHEAGAGVSWKDMLSIRDAICRVAASGVPPTFNDRQEGRDG